MRRTLLITEMHSLLTMMSLAVALVLAAACVKTTPLMQAAMDGDRNAMRLCYEIRREYHIEPRHPFPISTGPLQVFAPVCTSFMAVPAQNPIIADTINNPFATREYYLGFEPTG